MCLFFFYFVTICFCILLKNALKSCAAFYNIMHVNWDNCDYKQVWSEIYKHPFKFSKISRTLKTSQCKNYEIKNFVYILLISVENLNSGWIKKWKHVSKKVLFLFFLILYFSCCLLNMPSGYWQRGGRKLGHTNLAFEKFV